MIRFSPAHAALQALLAGDVSWWTTRWRMCSWPLWRLDADFSVDDLTTAWSWLTEQWSDDEGDYESQAHALSESIRYGLDRHPSLSMSLRPYLDAWPMPVSYTHLPSPRD